MSHKYAFVVYAGPHEAGRVFHALTHAKQAHARQDAAEVFFAAEGTYWPGAIRSRDRECENGQLCAGVI